MPSDIRVSTSSGNAQADALAIEYARVLRWSPAEEKGRKSIANIRLPVVLAIRRLTNPRTGRKPRRPPACHHSLSTSAVQKPWRWCTGSQRTRSAGIASPRIAASTSGADAGNFASQRWHGLRTPLDLRERRLVRGKELRPLVFFVPGYRLEQRVLLRLPGVPGLRRSAGRSAAGPHRPDYAPPRAPWSSISRAVTTSIRSLLKATYTGRVPATMYTP